MVEIIQQNNNIKYGVTSLVADTRADLVNFSKDVASGSTCIVIEDSSVWMLAPDGEWYEL